MRDGESIQKLRSLLKDDPYIKQDLNSCSMLPEPGINFEWAWLRALSISVMISPWFEAYSDALNSDDNFKRLCLPDSIKFENFVKTLPDIFPPSAPAVGVLVHPAVEFKTATKKQQHLFVVLGFKETDKGSVFKPINFSHIRSEEAPAKRGVYHVFYITMIQDGPNNLRFFTSGKDWQCYVGSSGSTLVSPIKIIERINKNIKFKIETGELPLRPMGAKETTLTEFKENLQMLLAKGSWIAQPKRDGIRALIQVTKENIIVFTRAGHVLDLASRFTREIEQVLDSMWSTTLVTIFLDGELHADGFQSSDVAAALAHPTGSCLKFYIFDMILCSKDIPTEKELAVPFAERDKSIRALELSESLGSFESWPIASSDDLESAFSRASSDYEGIVLKLTSAPYISNGKTIGVQKIKLSSVCDVTCSDISFTNSGMIVFALFSPNYGNFAGTPRGWNAEQLELAVERLKFHKQKNTKSSLIDSTVSVSFNGVTPKGVPKATKVNVDEEILTMI